MAGGKGRGGEGRGDVQPTPDANCVNFARLYPLSEMRFWCIASAWQGRLPEPDILTDTLPDLAVSTRVLRSRPNLSLPQHRGN